MVGMGSLEHLKILLNDPNTHEEYAHLWNTTSTDWAERSDVYIKFDDQIGKLTAGLGAAGPSRGGHIGPELEFGWVLGDHLHCPCSHPILLLKSAYGGRNLAIDFRPPLSGMGNYSGVKPVHYGWEYREMIANIQNTLDNDLPSIMPNYNKDKGYELAGFVWFQGWNDMLNVIIGELGMHGLHPTGRGADRVMAMRAAEERLCQMDEFRQSSIFVPTAKYVVDNGTDYNGDYHYNGRADTYCHIGKAFGRAMLKLLKRNSTTRSKDEVSLRGSLSTTS